MTSALKIGCITVVLSFWAAIVVFGYQSIKSHPHAVKTAPATANSPTCKTNEQKKQLSGIVASRGFALNHLIREQDLNWGLPHSKSIQTTDFVNHYSACAIKEGETVLGSEVLLLPRIDPAPGHVAFPFGLRDIRISQAADVGTKIDLWDHNVLLAQNVSILAIQCGANDPVSDCMAILEIAPEQLSRLQIVELTSTTILLRQNKP
ncbi:hypothetical protein FTO74_10735 [Granulicella sp. WH15]|uniref:hypothetical protein n=1 Tax=Granulicella sp. WH15 TaxID=2602070 RepID=UPI001366AC17|nr:hypothetical protein [Granulicella sp. WH15]QHN03797.1 hypothetical protein FTO74_10735 [Granulicella sp. WH15]